ncbi:MAG: beta-lactamase family protein, partial [Gammaproteobacteria bacterium]|nr:beta-lactamase family protein [Gammaproteobacteria bacterium]
MVQRLGTTVANKVAEEFRIEGTVAPGFESVKQLFEHNMRNLAEENAQLCVYVGEEKVVDLWASAAGEPNFTGDSLVNIFSSGKSLEAIAMATLVAKGLLNYDAKITDYWPEFGAHGKQQLTVAQLMRHEAGLAAFDVSLDPQNLLRHNIKQNKIGNVIERQSQKFRKGAGKAREYHAVTRGWIVNEVFRRVDPHGRTIGEFLRDDVYGPLSADVVIGVEEGELNRVTKVSPIGIGFHLRESLKPRVLGRRVKDNIFQITGKLLRMIPALRSGTTTNAPAPFIGMKDIVFFNTPAVVMGETPSANAHCSARGLAKVAAVMAMRGVWAGSEVLSEVAWKAMHKDPVKADMGLRTTFTQGGVALFSAI